MSYEDTNTTPALPTIQEVIDYAATWGNTADEVAAWLREHGITDSPELASNDNILRCCVVAMGLRRHFSALDATADDYDWSVLGGGRFEIRNGPNDYDEGELPAPVHEVVRIADNHRKDRDGPYPFLYAPTPTF
jgi:hypothetical protein